MDFKFLSIGGNCAVIHTLGEKRILGPVDNMKSKNGLSSVKAIFENGGLEEEFIKIGEIEEPFCGNHRDENEIWYSTQNYFIIHNNFRDKKFQKDLKGRIKNMYDYITNMKNDTNKYLIYSLSEKDINPVTNKMSNLFIDGVKLLKKHNVFERVVFLMVTSEDRKWYHFKCSDVYNYSNNVIDMNIKINNIEENAVMFYESMDILNYNK